VNPKNSCQYVRVSGGCSREAPQVSAAAACETTQAKSTHEAAIGPHPRPAPVKFASDLNGMRRSIGAGVLPGLEPERCRSSAANGQRRASRLGREHGQARAWDGSRRKGKGFQWQGLLGGRDRRVLAWGREWPGCGEIRTLARVGAKCQAPSLRLNWRAALPPFRG
jgi:hypothetical protein